MNRFKWKDSYALGEAGIDQQHQHLFDLANQALETDEQERLISIIMQLYKHLREHFGQEEGYLKQISYPNYKMHVDIHNMMLDKLNLISVQIHSKQMTQPVLENFMQQWIDHISIDDALVRDYAKTIA